MRTSYVPYALLLGMVALILLCTPCLGDVEPNDDIDGAETINSGAHTGSVDPDAGDYDDYYIFSSDPGSLIELEFSNLASAGRMTVLLMYPDPWEEGSYIVAFEMTMGFGEDTGRYGTDSRTDINTFILQVHSDAYEPGSYSFTLKLWSQTDGDIWGDAPGATIEARTIPSGGTFEGYLGNDDEFDCFEFEAPPGSMVELRFTSYCEEMTRGEGQSLVLANATQEELCRLCSMDGGVDTFSLYLPNEPGEDDGWYITIWSGSENELLPSADGDYQFFLRVSEQNDAGSYADAGNWLGNALSIEGSENITGHLEAMDLADVYRIRAGAGDIIEVALRVQGTGEMEAYLEDGEARRSVIGKFFAIECSGGGEATAVHVASGTERTWYYLVVSIGGPGWPFTGAPGDYELDIRYTQQDDGGFGGDAPASASFAPKIGSGTYLGTVGDDDDTDCYAVDIPPNGRLKLTLQDVDLSPGDLRAKVYGDVGSVDAIGRIDEDPQGGIVSEVWDTTEAVTWYVKVTGESTGLVFGYRLGVVVDAEPPVVDFDEPEPYPLGGPLTISVRASDDQGIAEVRLHYRIGGKGQWNSSLMALRGEVYEATFGRGAIGDAEKVTYYIEVVDVADRVVGRGSLEEPYTVEEVYSLLGLSGTGLVMLLLLVVGVVVLAVAGVVLRVRRARAAPSTKEARAPALGTMEREALRRSPARVNPGVQSPKDFTVTPGPDGNRLRWTPPPAPKTMPIAGYRVLRGTSPDRIEPLRGLEPHVNEHLDPGVSEGTTYYYRMSTVTVEGDSPPTEVARAGMGGLPGHPIYPNGYVSEGGIVIEWRPPTDTGGQPVTRYAIGRGDDEAHMGMVGDVPGDQHYYVDTDVELDRSYIYSVRAITQSGMGEQSKFVHITFE